MERQRAFVGHMDASAVAAKAQLDVTFCQRADVAAFSISRLYIYTAVQSLSVYTF